MTTILNGVLGGLLAGLVAAIAVRFRYGDAPITATALERTVGERASSSQGWRFAVQISYGGLGGGVLLALELSVLRVLPVPPTVGEALGVTVAWSALLFGVLVAVWRFGSSISGGRSPFGELLVYHLVYGLGLGVWIRLTWIT